MAFQGDSIFWVEVEKVLPNPFQPRREFDEAKLKELSESVRMYGILQPLTVTRREVQNEDGSFRSEYELIAGERRLRASKLAGLSQVPVIIREGEQSEQEKLELAIIENLQREDLNAVDRALAFRQLADVFGLSHTQVAHKVGRSREYVSNTIRLLALPDYMLTALRTGDMSEGHARTLLMLNDRPEEQDTVFREILLKKLSVREVERIARGIASEKIRKKGDYDADLVEMEKKFTETLGTRVSIVKTEFGGRLSIDYFTVEDLTAMLERMKVEAGSAAVSKALAEPMPHDLSQFLEPREIANPREVELMALTNSTGLEVAPETHGELEVYEAPETPAAEPVMVQEMETETPVSVEETFVPAPQSPIDLFAAEEIDPEFFRLPLPDEEIPEGDSSTSDSDHTVEPEPIEIMHPDVTEETLEEPKQMIEEEVYEKFLEPVVPEAQPQYQPEPTPIVLPAPTPTPAPRSSLRDQLAALLGQTPKPVIRAVEPIVPPVAQVTPLVVISSPQVTQAVDEDDSNLYNLKDFSI